MGTRIVLKKRAISSFVKRGISKEHAVKLLKAEHLDVWLYYPDMITINIPGEAARFIVPVGWLEEVE